MIIRGECFCGDVKYEVEGGLKSARSCHCSRCRHVFSGAGSAFAELGDKDGFRWTAGEDLLTKYVNAQGLGLCFCKVCGSTLGGIYQDKVMGVTLGSVTGDPGVQIEYHLFVGSKAPWDHIGGTAPQYDEFPPSE